VLGNNPIRRPVFKSGDWLEIKEIYRSIQGEGPNSGCPAVFIRLGGCNLACNFCDTDFEDFSTMSLKEILAEAGDLGNPSLAVITGGEPLRQPIENLCDSLLAAGFRVQIETNGTIFRPLDVRVEIVCSPKNLGKGYFPLRDDLLGRLNALKFLVSAHDPLYAEIPEIGQARYKIPVYVQPMDEFDAAKNQSNLALAAGIARKNGYHLSLQMHKIVGIR